MIKLRNISKLYGTKKVVDDVNIELPKGQLIAFIGSNGAGKSTLISIISRILSKNSGEVYIDGKELSEWKSDQLARQLSILKQHNHLNIRLTVRDLVSFGRFPYSKGKLTSEDEAKIDEAIEYMGIKEFENRFLDELSGGQRQMAYIAMVLAQDTEYIFLDEPLNNLDMKHSIVIMKILKRLVSELGKTVIVVIHDINFVSYYADYVVAMKDGKIVSYGPTTNIIDTALLRNIYDIDIDIKNINDKKICLFYG